MFPLIGILFNFLTVNLEIPKCLKTLTLEIQYTYIYTQGQI